MSKERYNCFWGVDFLPTRTEAYIMDRNTSKWLMQEFALDIDNTEDAVKEFMSSCGVKVFNYEKNINTFQGKTTVSYSGKGMLNEYAR